MYEFATVSELIFGVVVVGVGESFLLLVFAYYPKSVPPTYKLYQIKNKERKILLNCQDT